MAEVPFQHAARRFAELVCPPEVRVGQRADRVLGELGLMLGSLPPVARKALAAALVLLDQGARLYPPSRGRRFARLGDEVAGRTSGRCWRGAARPPNSSAGSRA